MKEIIISFLFFIIIRNNATAQNEKDFSGLDTDLILQKLFDATKIDGSIVEWKPNFAERMYLTVSENGISYTKVDTIIRFKVKNDLAVLVFHTYSSREQTACDTCPKNVGIVIFEKKPDAKWTMRAFNKSTTKYMQSGKIYNYRLIKINSVDIYALAFNLEYNHPNNTYSYRELFLYNVYNPDHNDISLAFTSLIYYSNKENANKNLHYSYSIDVKFMPTSFWYEIETTTKGMMPDINDTKLLPYNSKRRYFYDQSFMAYAAK